MASSYSQGHSSSKREDYTPQAEISGSCLRTLSAHRAMGCAGSFSVSSPPAYNIKSNLLGRGKKIKMGNKYTFSTHTSDRRLLIEFYLFILQESK